jgi:hypothetical protein
VDLAILSAVPLGPALVRARLSALSLAIDPLDRPDALSPGAWTLTGAGAPQVCHLTLPAQPPDTPLGYATEVDITFDAPLVAGGAYQLGLAPWVGSLGSLPVSPLTVPLAGPVVAPVAGQVVGVAGGDVTFPLSGQATGDLSVVDRVTALTTRLTQLVASRRGSFVHLPTYGRGTEPKRTYSAGAITAEAAALKAALLADQDVADASVTVSTSGHGLTFGLTVKPTFSPDPIALPPYVLGPGAP